VTRTVAFQGEPGAFGEDALLRHFGDEVERRAGASFADVFDLVASGAAAAGVVPIENSLHGSVLEVYDLLLEHELAIVGEVSVPVRHCLLALPGVAMDEVRVVHSHPQALAQSLPFLREHGFETRASYNTAGAARDVAAAGDRQAAAIAGERAAGLYGLQVLARDIQRRRSNTTRFVVLEQGAEAAADGQPGNKATLVYTTANEPGALHRTLGRFAELGVNLTRLESRPTRDTPWEYYFWVDCERVDRGPIEPAFLESVTSGLRDVADTVRVLGIYPAAGPID
jgi:prephenate dehydratase